MFLVYLSVLFIPVYARISSFELVGSVKEANNEKPIPFVTIQVFKDSLTTIPIYSCISDSVGMFQINLEHSGKYQLSFSCVGKQSKIIRADITTDNFTDLGDIKMEDSNAEIGVVNVIGSKPLVEVHPDMMVYNVSDDVMSLSSDLLSITEKVPLINVDPEVGVLLNNCTPLILINGRESKAVNKNPIFYLSSMPASRVSKVEVITLAGSKFNSDANCGVINIVYKKQDNKSLSVGSQLNSITGYVSSLDFGFKHKKIILNASVGYGNGKNFNSNEFLERLNKQDAEFHNLVQSGETKQDFEIVNRYSLETSYDLDSLNLLSFTTSYYHNRMNNNTAQFNEMSNINDDLIYSYNLDEKHKSIWRNYDLSFNYKSISRNKKNVFNLSLLKDNEYINRIQDQVVLEGENYQNIHYLTILDEESDENSLQIDFVRNLYNSNKLNLGSKFVFRDNNSNSSRVWENDADAVEEDITFDNSQRILSLYSEYSFNLPKKYKWHTGLRFETTNIDANFNSSEEFSSSYTNLLPHILISKKTSSGIIISSAYNSKINRPSIQALNPSLYVIDANSIYFGNPKLTSEYLSTISVDYNNNLHLIKHFIQFSYSLSNNTIQNYSYIEDDTYYTTYTNDGKFKEFSLFINLSARFTSWLNSRLNGSLDYVNISTQNESNSGFTGMVYASAYFKLPRAYNINLNGMYRFPRILAQGISYNYYSFRAKATKVFFDDRLNVSFTMEHPFWENRKYSKTIDSDFFHMQTDKYILGRTFSISVMYSFNDNKIKSRKSGKKIVNKDIKGGISAQ
ncbi:hypothetical protein JCM21142_114575 [Saccharicrinis fermentans DSM 9555 = JCM 21142]|uniref:Outer membrane protein beta-barrel domain-containing protein n=1 Tax=Saccharicrinis fermentans DSM 9555 = JCM 21142 TaxID=869213 RepID=W7YMD2_9BACT|nr:hypothetical protein JCM21142_114575 [Saccharicrinis fermentans DSM 9555 = JCM 21142]